MTTSRFYISRALLRVRRVVRDLTDHVLEKSFKLIEHDDKPTR